MLTFGGLHDEGKIFVKIISKITRPQHRNTERFITKTSRLKLFTEIFAIYRVGSPQTRSSGNRCCLRAQVNALKVLLGPEVSMVVTMKRVPPCFSQSIRRFGLPVASARFVYTAIMSQKHFGLLIFVMYKRYFLGGRNLIFKTCLDGLLALNSIYH